MPWHSQTWLIGHPFCGSQQIGNIFCLHAAISEIPKWRFRIKSPACWGTDVSIDMYHLLLLFSIILPWLKVDYKCPQNYTFLIPKLLSGDINYHDLRKKLIKRGKKEITLSDRNGYEISNFILTSCLYFIHRSTGIVRNILYRIFLISLQFMFPKIFKTHLPRFWPIYAIGFV